MWLSFIHIPVNLFSNEFYTKRRLLTSNSEIFGRQIQSEK